jgi:hypothetical protein
MKSSLKKRKHPDLIDVFSPRFVIKSPWNGRMARRTGDLMTPNPKEKTPQEDMFRNRLDVMLDHAIDHICISLHFFGNLRCDRPIQVHEARHAHLSGDRGDRPSGGSLSTRRKDRQSERRRVVAHPVIEAEHGQFRRATAHGESRCEVNGVQSPDGLYRESSAGACDDLLRDPEDEPMPDGPSERIAFGGDRILGD